jgi:hypothetical protein
VPPPQYAPPGGGFAPPPYQPGGQPPGGGSGIEASEAIAFGWAAVTKDFAGVALPIAVAIFVAALPGIVLGGIRGAIVAGFAASGAVDSTALMILNLVGPLLNFVISTVVQAYVMGGIVLFALRVARGEKPEFGVVFSGGKYFASVCGATLLYNFAVGFGLAFCLVPGLFLAACWVAYLPFIVDKGMGSVDALKASWQATTPYRMNLVIYVVLAFLVGIAGFLACFIGALLVSFPVIMLGNAYLYLKLVGEQPRLAGT